MGKNRESSQYGLGALFSSKKGEQAPTGSSRPLASEQPQQPQKKESLIKPEEVYETLGLVAAIARTAYNELTNAPEVKKDVERLKAWKPSGEGFLSRAANAFKNAYTYDP